MRQCRVVRTQEPIILLLSAVLATVPSWKHAARAASPGPERSTLTAVEQAHTALWTKFVDRHGILLDYIGEIPTPEDCALGKPNALGWFSPIENGPMFTGIYLPAVCERARRSGKASDKAEAQRLARGLLKCASVSDVPGFIARGVGTDGRCHYPLGSDDQTHPWFLGLYAYWKSGIPENSEKQEIVGKVKQVAEVLEANIWKCPCDGAFQGASRGWFKSDSFRNATRYLFMLRAVHAMTGDAAWLRRYQAALAEKPAMGKRELSRLEVCAAGYAPDIPLHHWSRGAYGPFWMWLYVPAQASLAYLAEMEDEGGIKARFRNGLSASAVEALPAVAEFKKFDNNDTKVFGSARWRDVYAAQWFPQKTQADAVKLSEMADKNKAGERFSYEARFVRVPLAAAAVVAWAGDPAHREAIENAIRHYDYSRVNLCQFFYAECAYYARSTH